MSVLVTVKGVVPVKNVHQVEAIVEKFNDISTEITAKFDGKTVTFSGSSILGNGSILELKTLIGELSPYACPSNVTVTESKVVGVLSAA